MGLHHEPWMEFDPSKFPTPEEIGKWPDYGEMARKLKKVNKFTSPQKPPTKSVYSENDYDPARLANSSDHVPYKVPKKETEFIKSVLARDPDYERWAHEHLHKEL